MVIFPHKNDRRARRAPEGPEHEALGPGGGLSIERPSARPALCATFRANTCPTCGYTTIAGLWKGLRVDLEPTVLTDLDEATAIRDQVPTYNFHAPATVTPRFLIAITSPTKHDRHARHTCGTTYGTLPRTATRTRTTPQTDEPPF